jgi:hypothetical protein
MMFSFFQNKLRKGRSRATAPSIPEPSHANKAAGNAPPFDATKWALDNPWLVEGQADDRNLMNGAVPVTSGTLGELRSYARRTHQEMFKKWSQARHD